MHRSGSDSNQEFPAKLNRDYERQLLEFCALRTLDCARWAELGPTFFMAGIAVMLASTSDFDRRNYLALAEQLCPGASTPEVFAQWLKGTPVRPSRFLPLLKIRVRMADDRGT